tara:strand:- start:5966 stop:6583 length:618 start_codon:yes stop_codon:yes gene_type:complete
VVATTFRVELTGEVKALNALAEVDRHARFAQKTAIRATGRKGRSIIAKALASRFNVPLKLFKKRARFFNARSKSSRDPIARARLWLGVEAQLRASEHKSVATQLRARFPQGFSPKLKSGHSAWFVRALPSRRVGKGARGNPDPWNRNAQRARHALPLKELTIDFSPGAPALVKDTARRVMRTTYPDTLKADYKRRIDKVRAKQSQ